MKTFTEISSPQKSAEENTGFPTFRDVISTKFDAAVKEKEVDEATRKLEELKAELSGLQQKIKDAEKGQVNNQISHS